MDMETFRVTRDVALAKTPLAKLDFGEATLVKTDRAIPHAHDCTQVRYRIRMNDGDPLAAFTTGPSPAVKRIDEHTAEVTVRAIRPDSKDKTSNDKSAVAPDLPTDADRQPNNFIQSDDPLIVSQAKEAAGEETDPWKVAVTLESYVHHAMKIADFTRTSLFATASDVAPKSLKAIAKGHAVYLAALARARKIPARRWLSDSSICRRRRLSAVTCGLKFILPASGSGWMAHWPRAALAEDIWN